jgi:hypothetical protein
VSKQVHRPCIIGQTILEKQGRKSMRGTILFNLLACVALAAVPMIMTSLNAAAQAPAAPAAPPAPLMPPALVPAYTVNLMTAEGSAAFGAVWKTMEARVVEVDPMAGRMSGYDKTYDMLPHAGEAGFDDSNWPTIEAKELADRRGGGKTSFLWYRANLTIPPKIGDFDTAGAKAVFTAYVDDYAEVWINGQVPRRSGYPSPAHHPGPQHAQSCRARRDRQPGRQVPGRGIRDQRADFGRAIELHLLSRREGGVL